MNFSDLQFDNDGLTNAPLHEIIGLQRAIQYSAMEQTILIEKNGVHGKSLRPIRVLFFHQVGENEFVAFPNEAGTPGDPITVPGTEDVILGQRLDSPPFKAYWYAQTERFGSEIQGFRFSAEFHLWDSVRRDGTTDPLYWFNRVEFTASIERKWGGIWKPEVEASMGSWGNSDMDSWRRVSEVLAHVAVLGKEFERRLQKKADAANVELMASERGQKELEMMNQALVAMGKEPATVEDVLSGRVTLR